MNDLLQAILLMTAVILAYVSFCIALTNHWRRVYLWDVLIKTDDTEEKRRNIHHTEVNIETWKLFIITARAIALSVGISVPVVYMLNGFLLFTEGISEKTGFVLQFSQSNDIGSIEVPREMKMEYFIILAAVTIFVSLIVSTKENFFQNEEYEIVVLCPLCVFLIAVGLNEFLIRAIFTPFDIQSLSLWIYILLGFISTFCLEGSLEEILDKASEEKKKIGDSYIF